MPTIPIFKMFGLSPIRPLQQHMEKAQLCVEELGNFFTAVLAEDWKTAAEVQRYIVKLENEADNLKRDLRLHLPKGLFMPVARTDLLELLTRQDILANRSKDIAGLVLGRKMVFPDEIQEDYLLFLKRNIDASAQANKAIKELDKLFEVGFSGKEVHIINDMVEELLQIERDTDKMEIKIRQTIFSMEAELPPVNVMFLYKIIEWTGNIANSAQHVGDGLQIMIAR